MASESQGRIDLALAEYERALKANPLRLSLQQRYGMLKRRGVKPTPSLEPSLGSDVSGLWERSDPSWEGGGGCPGGHSPARSVARRALKRDFRSGAPKLW